MQSSEHVFRKPSSFTGHNSTIIDLTIVNTTRRLRMKSVRQNHRRSMIAGIILSLVFLITPECSGTTFVHKCQEYTVHHQRSNGDWKQSRDFCLDNESHLVCIEHQEELNFLVQELIKLKSKSEYFIGLSEYNGLWTWICNRSIVVTPKKSPWDAAQPYGDGSCGKMYFSTERDLVYDNIPCENYEGISFICEKRVSSCPKKAVPVTTGDKRSINVTTTTIQTSSATSAGATDSAITIKQQHGEVTRSENPGGQVKDTSDGNSQLITIAVAVLAVVILVICVFLWFFFIRRPRIKASNTKRRQVDQQQKNCTQLRKRLDWLPSEREMEEYEDMHEIKRENAPTNIKYEKRKSRHRESFGHEQSALIQSQSSDGYLAPCDESTPAGTSEKSDILNDQERQHVYAVVNIHDNQDKVTFHRDPEMQDTDTCPTGNGENYKASVDLSSLGFENEVKKKDGAFVKQNASRQDECKDDLYAVADNLNKKRQPPQMPAPYHGVIYADLSHSPEKSNGKINRASLATLYADIDHLKTDAMSESRLPK
ncbi:uncharacterized protein [Montipora foliosa]|uniref:uncharacterized protein n=1 Tax=Montipora foliosa TaxID=591990 RepID=UPI0035F1712E